MLIANLSPRIRFDPVECFTTLPRWAASVGRTSSRLGGLIVLLLSVGVIPPSIAQVERRDNPVAFDAKSRPILVRADGTFSDDLQSTRVLVLQGNGWQDLVIEPRVGHGPRPRFWLLPLPGPAGAPDSRTAPSSVTSSASSIAAPSPVPTVQLEDPALFASLEEYTSWEHWGRSITGGRLDMTECATPVIPRVFPRIGVDSLAVFGPEEREALAAWIHLEDAATLVDLPAGSWIVAARLIDAGPAHGTVSASTFPTNDARRREYESDDDEQSPTRILPIRVRFQASRPWLPDLSRTQELVLYTVLEDVRIGAAAQPPQREIKGDCGPAMSETSPTELHRLPYELPSVQVLDSGGRVPRSRKPELRTPATHTWLKTLPQDVWGQRVGADEVPLGVSFLTRMEDRTGASLSLLSYDPQVAIRSPHAWTQRDAATYLGYYPAAKATNVLLDALRSPETDELARLSVLWALGQSAELDLLVPELLVWAGDGTAAERIEAVESLVRSGDPAVKLALIPGATQTGDGSDDRGIQALRHLCRQRWIELGNSEYSTELREIAAGLPVDGIWGGSSQVNTGQSPNGSAGGASGRGSGASSGGRAGTSPDRSPDRASLDDPSSDLARFVEAASAVCGDPEAFLRLVDAIVVQGTDVASPTVIEERGRRTGSSGNSYPMSVYGGGAIVMSPGHAAPWDSYGFIYDLLAPRPAFRDSLLRRAASDERLSPSGRAILYTGVVSGTSEDAKQLEGILRKALQDPLWVAEGEFGTPYNHPACLAVYAFVLSGRGTDLLDLYRAGIAGTDEMLRGEIVFSLARGKVREAAPEVARYVRETWRAPAEQIEQLLLAGESPQRSVLRNDRSFDLPYRTHGIRGYLTVEPGCPAEIRALATDPTLPPVLRLLSIDRAPFYREDFRAFAPECLAVLDELEAGDSGHLEELIDSTRRSVTFGMEY